MDKIYLLREHDSSRDETSQGLVEGFAFYKTEAQQWVAREEGRYVTRYYDIVYRRKS